MQSINFTNIRRLLVDLPTDHDADGEHKPTVGDVFAPEQHASALAPSTLIVVGARGAGKSFWAGEVDINSLSIGIEIANAGHPGGLPDFPEAQIAAVIALCRDIAVRRGIAPERILGHSDVAPVRKVDPGEKFPWDRLAAGGVGHWVEPAALGGGRFFQQGDSGQPVEALQSMLSLYGYGVEISGEYDAKTAGCVEAFQRHFRAARVDGIADVSTIDTLHRLLTALPRFGV